MAERCGSMNKEKNLYVYSIYQQRENNIWLQEN